MTALGSRARRVLTLIIALAVAALVALIGVLHAPRSMRAGPLPLELSASAAAFRQTVLTDWLQAPDPQGPFATCGLGVAHVTDIAQLGPETPSFGRLRCNLFFDSVLLVPAYVALLVFLTLALGPPVQRHPWLRQLLCVPAVAAGLFDVAENSMTGRALDDLLLFALHDATVADVTLAARIKWLLLGAAVALLAWRAWAVRAADRPWLTLAATLGLATALALAAGGAWAATAALQPGLLGFVALAALLCVRLLRQRGASPPA